MHWKFWKKPPSLNLRKNIRRPRPPIVLYEVITGAIALLMQTVLVTLPVIGAVTVFHVVAAIVIAGSILATRAAAQKGKPRIQGSQARDFKSSGHLITTTSQSEPISIPYGACRNGGNVVYKHCTGEDNKFYHRIITFGFGPVNKIKQDGQGDKIWLDDKRIQDFGSLAYWEFFTGTSTQGVCETLQAAHPEFDDAMRDIVYLYLRLEYDSEKFASEPQVTIELEGRLLYDPRDGQTKFTANNALVAYDFLRSDLYSIGLPSEVFDEDLIKDAANWCDANGYEFNGSIMDRQSLLENFEIILQNFRAGLPWSEGLYKLIVYEYDTPVMTLTEDDIEADSFKIVGPGIPETPNRCLITYMDATNNYISKTKPVEDPSAVLIYDGEERDFEVDLKGTTNALQAEKLGYYFVERNRLNLQFPLVTHSRTLALDPIDMIQITHSLPGWTEKIVRVLNVEPRQDGRVNLLVLAELSSLYDDDVDVAEHNAYETNLPDPLAPPPNVTNLTLEEATDKPGIVATFTRPGAWSNWDHAKIFISTDGITYNSVAMVRTDAPFVFHDVIPGEKYWIKIISYSILGKPSTNPPVESIEILTEGLRPPRIRGLELFGQGNDTEWKGKHVKFAWRPIMLKSGANFNPADQDLLNAGQGFPDAVWQDYRVEIWVGGLKVREEYRKSPDYIYIFEKNLEDNGEASNTITIKVWNRSIWNILSSDPAVLEVTNPLPPIPTGLDTYALMSGVKAVWPPSTISDHLYWRIRTKVEGTDWGDWEYTNNLEYIRMLSKEEIEDYGFTTVYFELKDVDTFYQESSVAASIQGLSFSPPLEIEDYSITETKIATDAISTPKIQANAVVADKIAANTIGAGHIIAGAIETEKIKALAVKAEKIDALAITTDKLAANAVTSGKITTGELITLAAQIKSAIITNAHLMDATIETAKIKNAAIETAKIGDLQVTTLKVANNAITNRAEARLVGFYAYSGSWPNIITLQVTTNGGNIIIIGRLYYGATGTMSFRLVRDSTVIDGPVAFNNSAIILMDADSPAAGTYIYKIQGDAGGPEFGVFDIALITTEYLR